MIDPVSTLIVMGAFFILYAIILPLLECSKRFGAFVSYRWQIVVVYLAMTLAVMLDFKHLTDSFRITVLVGGLVIAFIYLIARSLEKKIFSRVELEAKWRDLEGKFNIKQEGGHNDEPKH